MYLKPYWRFKGYWLGFIAWLCITAGPMAGAVFAEQGFRFIHLCSAIDGAQYYDTGEPTVVENCDCLWTLAPNYQLPPPREAIRWLVSEPAYQSVPLATYRANYARAPPDVLI